MHKFGAVTQVSCAIELVASGNDFVHLAFRSFAKFTGVFVLLALGMRETGCFSGSENAKLTPVGIGSLDFNGL